MLSLFLLALSQTPAPSPPPAKIVMYRPGALLGAAIACPIRYRGENLVELGRSKYAEWSVPAGSYILSNKTASVEVNLQPGQTKYVRCQVKTGFLGGRADLQIVDRESYERQATGFERKAVAAIKARADE